MLLPRLPSALLTLLVPSVANAARFHDDAYIAGFRGLAPTQKYHSIDLRPPELNIFATQPPSPPPNPNGTTAANSSQPLLTFLGYRGSNAEQPGPMIIDDDGELVWYGPEYGGVLNVERHTYLGQDVFSFYTGTEQYPGFGNGQFNILNASYDIIATVTSKNTTHGLDPHDFFIVHDIATVEFWIPHQLDLSGIGGQVDGWVYDCRVQSINITSGELLFDWSTVEHVPVEDTFYNLVERDNGKTINDPFDYFHLNSVQMDSLGNYVLGARGTSTVYYVDGKTGEVLWRLGGRRPSFFMGDGVGFWFQHHARAIPTGPDTFNISLFDNGANQYEQRAVQTRGVVLHVNTTSLNTTLLRQVLPPFHDICPSEGSVQTFPDGRILVGWGIRPYYTEFDSEDQVLHDVQFGTWDSTVHSYRAFKSPWKGYPRTHPSFAFNSSAIDIGFVSWNGATEVSTWRVLGGNMADDLVEVSSANKTGFETTLNLTTSSDFVAVAAFDAFGQCLGVSEVFSYFNATSTGLVGECPREALLSPSLTRAAFLIIVAVASYIISTRILPCILRLCRGGYHYTLVVVFVVILMGTDAIFFTANLVSPKLKHGAAVPPSFSPTAPPSIFKMPGTWLLCMVARFFGHNVPDWLERWTVWGGIGYDGDWGEMQAPTPTDSRGPCPALNSLANHGILPRDGRHITFNQFASAISRSYNLAPTLGVQLISPFSVFYSGRDWIDLEDIGGQGVVQHDGSTLREDISGPFAHATVIATQREPSQRLIAFFYPESTTTQYTWREHSKILAFRRAASREQNGTFSLSFPQYLFGSGNAAMIHEAIGGDLNTIRPWVGVDGYEHFPPGFEPHCRDVRALQKNVQVKQADRLLLRGGDSPSFERRYSH
ncbi:arylsulfate sulfotransferase, partial [Phenoliferia sp. Uapishka_3]